MVEIDLHGLKHKEVEDTLESMLISYYNLGSFPIRVITGHSPTMKKIVLTIIIYLFVYLMVPKQKNRLKKMNLLELTMLK